MLIIRTFTDGSLIVARYVHQIRTEKLNLRAMRASETRKGIMSMASQHESVHMEANVGLLEAQVEDVEGYGGGRWQHESIGEEKPSAESATPHQEAFSHPAYPLPFPSYLDTTHQEPPAYDLLSIHSHRN